MRLLLLLLHRNSFHQSCLCAFDNEALSSGEPKPIISNVARGPKARGQHWKLLAEGHHLIYSL